jgi:DNA polymerase III subunit alpha
MMAKMKSDFIEGAINTVGAERDLMEKFWKQLEDFAAYCFNKAHSACYAYIAYQTAYLKAHYPEAFMAALMTSDYDDTDRLAIEITECKKMGIDVLPPDINQSFHEFAVIPNEKKIRFGLDAIKNVGHNAVEEILRARKDQGGVFESMENYCSTVDCRIVNRKNLESLLKAGAFDGFDDRSKLINNIDSILAFSARIQKDSKSGQVDLFGNDVTGNTMKPRLTLADGGINYPQNEQLVWERELLGLYLSHHPLEDFEIYLSEKTTPLRNITLDDNGAQATIGGSIAEFREITTRNGQKMAFVKVADATHELEVVVFPKIYADTQTIWLRDQVVLVTGKLSTGRSGNGDSELKLLADTAQIIDLETAKNYKPKGKEIKLKPKQKKASAKPQNTTSPSVATKVIERQRLYIRLKNSDDQESLMVLKEKLEGYSGSTEVILVTGPTVSKQIIKLPQSINVNEESLRDLASIFGALNVVVK